MATPAVNNSASMKSIDSRVADIEKTLNIDAPAKDKPKEDQGFLVGQDLKMAARWNAANGVTFETTNKDFVAHIGFRLQDDWVWFPTRIRCMRHCPRGRHWAVARWNVLPANSSFVRRQGVGSR